MDENTAHDHVDYTDEIDDVNGVEEVQPVDAGFDTVEEYDMTPEDALAVILSARPIHQTARFGVPARKGMGAIAVKLRSLTDSEFKQLRKASQAPTGKKGAMELDDSLFLRNLVAAAVVEPKITSVEVRQALGVNRPYEVVDALFLPGRIGDLATKVMELSGFSDEDGLINLGEDS